MADDATLPGRSAPEPAPAPWWRSSLLQLHSLWAVVAKFGVVGLVALVVDVGLFNLLRFGGDGVLADKPLTAKVVSVTVATTVSYVLNRIWTFSDRQRSTGVAGEYVKFFVINGMAMLIALGTLWFTHYVLGLDSALADNISANGIGLVLGTLFRFWGYNRFVFPKDETSDDQPELVSASA